MDNSGLAFLTNELQKTCYQIRILGWTIGEMKHHEDSLPGVLTELEQTLSVALSQKNSLFKEVNRQLNKLPIPFIFNLVEDQHKDYSEFGIYVEGETDSISVKYIGDGSLRELQSLASEKGGRYAFLAQRDWGEQLPSTPEQRGEFWEISGDYSEVFWPFVIDLDGTCFALNDANSMVLDVENSEK